jgi:LCP family protein required for cell wall assembly
VPKDSSLRPQGLDGLSRRAQPAMLPRRRPFDSSAVARLRAPATASTPVAATPAPVKAAQPLAVAPQAVQTTPKKSVRRLPRAVGELAKAVVAVEAERPVTTPSAIPVRHLPPIDMDLPGEDSPLRQIDASLRHGKLAAFRRWTFRGAVAMLVVLLAGGGLLFYANLHKAFRGGSPTAAALKANVNPSLLKGEGDGRVNVLLLGRGGGNHDGPDLTDSIMVASIDPVNHTSTLVSIPRDLWVDIPNQGAMKINAAWETGEFNYLHKVAPGSTDPNAVQAGFDEADQVVESVLGITIHYNVLVNFQAFQQAVQTVGGVTVNVPSDLVDPTMAWQNGNNPILAKAGTDSFNGSQALNYVRSRETTSDFARADRQRSVLVALKDKVETAGTLSNPLKLAGLMNTFGNNVQTDLSIKDAQRLYSIVKSIPDAKTNSLSLAGAPNNYFTTGNMAGQSITLPTAGLFNYNDIQTFLRTQLKDPYLTKENAKVMVLNGTGAAGLATAKTNELKSYGYDVISSGNAPTNDVVQTTLVDLSHGKDKYTKHYLEQRFGVTATTTLPDNTIQTNGADFVIILGSDEASTP